MKETDIAEDVKRFIVDEIDSFGQLEVLLLLARDSSRAWSAQEVATELRSGASAEIHLNTLEKKGFLAKENGGGGVFRFAPAQSEVRGIVQKLLKYSVTYQSRIISLIYDKPVNRLRQLANAFVIGKSREDGDG